MYNLIEYSSIYSEAKGSLWFYSKYEATNFNADTLNFFYKQLRILSRTRVA